MKGFFVGAATATALVSGAAFADTASFDDRVYAGAALNIIDAANGERGVLDGRRGLKLFVGKRFSGLLGAEAYAHYDEFPSARNRRHKELSLGVDGMLYPIKCADQVEPFIKAGAGISIYNEDNDFDAFVAGGAGLNWKLDDVREGLSLRTDAALRLVLSDGTVPGRGDVVLEPMASIGLSYAFGAKPTIEEDCPVVLPVAEAIATADAATGMMPAQGGAAGDAAGYAPARAGGAEAAGGAAGGQAGYAPGARPADMMDSDKDGVIDAADKCAGTAAGVRVDVNGCPVPETVVIYFAFDSSELNSAAQGALDRVAANLNNKTFVVAIANGHADSTGTEEYNMGLSQRRAASVANYLQSKGVDGGMIRKRAYGEARPAADNSTEFGRAKNRRVEVNLLRQ